MNREILFRGKRADNGEWIEGFYVKSKGKAYISSKYPAETMRGVSCNGRETTNYCGLGNFYEVIPETVGRYTGLTDKNGRRIFEGDILDLTHYLIMDVGVVRFGEHKDLDASKDYPCGHVGFYVDVEKQRISVRKDILFFASECKVIGNIHDNPELLGGKEK